VLTEQLASMSKPKARPISHVGERAIALAADLPHAYAIAPPDIRRCSNQLFFEKVRLEDDEVVGVVYTPLMRELHDQQLVPKIKRAIRDLEAPDADAADNRRRLPWRCPASVRKKDSRRARQDSNGRPPAPEVGPIDCGTLPHVAANPIFAASTPNHVAARCHTLPLELAICLTPA
jgi:hypothetical protein